jgi:hypothetical protein
MSASRWIIGLALAAAFSSPVLASPGSADLSTQDASGQHTGGSNLPAHTLDNGSAAGGGTSALPARGSDAPASTSSDAGADPDSSLPVSGGGHQPAVHHSSVGWQSLLPGSIQ